MVKNMYKKNGVGEKRRMRNKGRGKRGCKVLCKTETVFFMLLYSTTLIIYIFGGIMPLFLEYQKSRKVMTK